MRNGPPFITIFSETQGVSPFFRDKFDIAKHQEYSIREPVLPAIFRALHKSIHNQIAPNRHIILINRPENFIHFPLTVFFTMLKLLCYFPKNYTFFFSFGEKDFSTRGWVLEKKVSTICCFSSSVIR